MTREILAGGDPEPEFRRLVIDPEKTFDGSWFGERLSVWVVDERAWSTLVADSLGPDDGRWSRAWWRHAEGSNLGSPDGEIELRGRTFVVWDRNDPEDDDPVPLDFYGDLPNYVCEHVGASTPKNLAAVLVDLARANDMTLGEFLTLAVGEALTL